MSLRKDPGKRKTIEEETFVCLDLEATGLDPKKDRIIEVAIAQFSGRSVINSFESLVNPKQSISKDSIKIHHITDDMVVGKPLIEELLPKLKDFVTSSVIVGHGITFDLALLAAESQRAHFSWSIDQAPFIDTLRLARLYGESATNSLQHLRDHFQIEQQIAHRAMGDVIVNIDLFYKLSYGFNHLKDLLNRLKKPILMERMPLGKYKGRLFKEIPLNYLLWSSKGKFDLDLLYSIRMELSRRKIGNNFFQAANPFQAL